MSETFQPPKKTILTGRGISGRGEQGRSLVEIMGTLAIMGILAIAGIWMYNSAMDKLKANTLINEAQKRAVVVAGQIGFQGRTNPSLEEFSDNTFSGGTFSTDVITDGLYQQFGVQVSGVSKNVCQNILNSIGDGSSIRRLSAVGNATETLVGCAENNTFLIVYNNDMSNGGRDVQYASESCGCQTACGQCIIENGTPTCVNECPAGGNTCSSNTDCQGECVACIKEGSATTGTCRACTRVAYLESTAAQYINTGVVPGGKKISAQVQFKINSCSGTSGIIGSHKGDGSNNIQFTVFQSQWRTKLNNFASFNGNWDSNIHTVRLNTTTGTYLDSIQTTPTQYTILSTNTSPLFLGAANYNGSPSGYLLNGRLYYGKIWDDGTLVRDFVPVLDPQGVPAMYDKVTKAFFYNAGSGNFTTGTP